MKSWMQFASRLDNISPEGAYAVMTKAQALEAEGRRIVHFEIGQPDITTYDHINQAGIEAIQSGHTRYNPPAGIPQLREVIAEIAGAQRDMHFDPSQVVIGPGAKPGLFFPTLAIIEPGDEVLYPDPGFPTYPAMIEVAGGIPVPVPLLEENSFSFDLNSLDELISERTRLIILNSPANPTGGVIPSGDIEHIARIALDHGIWIISDEIYSRLVYDSLHVPTIAGLFEHIIIVDGFSKTFAMTGWRLGYGIMPVELAQRVELLLTHSIGCTATFTQYAGLEALTSSQEMVTATVEEYQHRRDLIVAGLNAIPGISCQIPQGAFYVFPNVSALNLPVRQLADQLLMKAGVAVLPGTDFGVYGEGYLRLCYATSIEEIELGLDRMREFLSGKA